MTFQKGHKFSEEIKKKLSESRKGNKNRLGNKHTEESKQKISEALKGENHPLFGKHHTKESKQKNSESHKGKKLSKETCKKMSESHKGAKNSSWKEGIAPKNHLIRTSSEYKLWRKAVFERDNFICQKTGISGGELEAHHINNFADFSLLRLAIDNGITLSKKAHKEFHHIYGNKNNTKEQLIEFIKK